MSLRSSPSRRVSPAIRFRDEIERAEAEGVAPEDLTLHLTLGDMSLLKRDSSLPLTDISFSDGAMRFLGVKVESGGVTESRLLRA